MKIIRTFRQIKKYILKIFIAIFVFSNIATPVNAVEINYVSLNCDTYVASTINLVDMTSCPPLESVIPETPENLPSDWNTSLIGIFPPIASITQINFESYLKYFDEPIDSFYVKFAPLSKKKNKYVWINTPEDLIFEGDTYFRWNNSQWKNLSDNTKTCDDTFEIPGEDDEVYQEVWGSRQEVGQMSISEGLGFRSCLTIPNKSMNKLELKVQRSASSWVSCSYGSRTGWFCSKKSKKAYKEVFLTAYVNSKGTKISNK